MAKISSTGQSPTSFAGVTIPFNLALSCDRCVIIDYRDSVGALDWNIVNIFKYGCDINIDMLST